MDDSVDQVSRSCLAPRVFSAAWIELTGDFTKRIETRHTKQYGVSRAGTKLIAASSASPFLLPV